MFSIFSIPLRPVIEDLVADSKRRFRFPPQSAQPQRSEPEMDQPGYSESEVNRSPTTRKTPQTNSGLRRTLR